MANNPALSCEEYFSIADGNILQRLGCFRPDLFAKNVAKANRNREVLLLLLQLKPDVIQIKDVSEIPTLKRRYNTAQGTALCAKDYFTIMSPLQG